MKNQSKRKFTYLGQTYNLPKYFDCSLEIYATEYDPDVFRWYSKPTIRKSLDIDERWCRTSKAEVLGPIQWDLVTDRTDVLKIIAENSRMGKYGGPSRSNESIFAAKCPVRFKAGTAIFKNFFYHFNDNNLHYPPLPLLSFKCDDCATLYKMFFYVGGGDRSFEGDIFLSQSLEDVYDDFKAMKSWVRTLNYGGERYYAEILITFCLKASTSPKEFFLTFDRTNILDQIDNLMGSETIFSENSFEAFEDPPACSCELGTVNYLSLWYQIKQQLFDIINE